MAKVKKDFDVDYYGELSLGQKSTESAILTVCESKQQKPNNYISTTDVEHQTLKKEIELMVECNKMSQSKFGFKLTEPQFDPQPFFRFESAGSTDRNRFDDIPLIQQQITTPHFHKYDQKGRFLAFKTDKISNLQSSQLDVNKCFEEFCDQTNLSHHNNYPVIKTTPLNELELNTQEEDPLKNITFVK